MKRRLCCASLAILVCLLTSPGYAQTYFKACTVALSKPSFKALAAYLAPRGKLLDAAVSYSNPGQCFRLNDHEFLVLPKASFGIYHCDFNAGSGCTLYEGQVGRRWELPEIFKEFTDKRGKHFVLLKQDTLKDGIYTRTYDILYLVPASSETNGLPFTIQPLVGVSMNNDSGSLTEDLCGEPNRLGWSNLPETAGGVGAVSVGNNQDQNAAINFQITQENCATRRKTDYHEAF